MSNDVQTAKGVLAGSLAEIRARVGMSSAQDLADRVKELGGRLDRAAISKIESGARNVSLDEVLLLAHALNVAPVHLIAPLDDDELVQVAPSDSPVSASDLREWVRGRRALKSGNERIYRTTWIPESEWEQRQGRIDRAATHVEECRRALRIAKARLKQITSDLGAETARDRWAISSVGEETMSKRLERKLDAAYDAVAEAQVELDDAEWELEDLRAEGAD